MNISSYPPNVNSHSETFYISRDKYGRRRQEYRKIIALRNLGQGYLGILSYP